MDCICHYYGGSSTYLLAGGALPAEVGAMEDKRVSYCRQPAKAPSFASMLNTMDTLTGFIKREVPEAFGMNTMTAPKALAEVLAWTMEHRVITQKPDQRNRTQQQIVDDITTKAANYSPWTYAQSANHWR